VEEKSKTLLFRGTRLGDQGTRKKIIPATIKDARNPLSFISDVLLNRLENTAIFG
jgi:hypothetical protein